MAWQEGQKYLVLHEKASRYSCSQLLALGPEGRLHVLAGTGEGGDAGDGGSARACRFNRPCNLALMEGCLLISDHFNNRIRALKLAQ